METKVKSIDTYFPERLMCVKPYNHISKTRTIYLIDSAAII